MTRRTGRNPNEAGLTLLEVLASAMIFSMVMTVLIGTSSTAVHHIGLSARRLEANQLADFILADLEIEMKLGLTPEFDDAEIEHDLFAVQTSRSDFLGGTGGGGPIVALAGLGGDPEAGGGDIASILGLGLPEVAKHLKQYDIEVSWIEQAGPQRITRTTFAFDWQAASEEFGDLFAREGGGDIGTTANSDSGSGSAADSLPRTGGRSSLVPTGLATEAEKELLRERVRNRCDGRNARNSALGCK